MYLPRSFFARFFCCGGGGGGGVRVVFVEDFFFVFVVAGTDAALGSFEVLENNQPPVVGFTNNRNNVTATSLIVFRVECSVCSVCLLCA